MKNSDMPAMPIEINGFGQYAPEDHTGLTKREEAAIKLMAAYRTQHEALGAKPEEVAKWAVDDADALFEELEK
ncbi:MAG: hypothetical protein GY782_03645 [Gammaproteobacteria bacterium]|nr:hypothetical protein [Gammaproteobacteria bacterium]